MYWLAAAHGATADFDQLGKRSDSSLSISLPQTAAFAIYVEGSPNEAMSVSTTVRILTRSDKSNGINQIRVFQQSIIEIRRPAQPACPEMGLFHFRTSSEAIAGRGVSVWSFMVHNG
ncbi:MAG: hypothetical protein LAP21_24995 [Acidobacteriia bacterium]|nr:hypothetical protein [Terriglobia bacterium]